MAYKYKVVFFGIINIEMSESMQINNLIKKRGSIRNFNDQVISDVHIKLILEAGMKAPSACNMRPYHFYVIQNKEILNQLGDFHPYTKMLKQANVAIVVCMVTNLNNNLAKGYQVQDCSATTQNILLQASDLNIGTCWCGVFPREELVDKLKAILNIQEDYIQPMNIIALGYTDSWVESKGFYEESKVTFIK